MIPMTLFIYDLAVKILFTLLIICSCSDLSSLFAACINIFSIRTSEISYTASSTLNFTLAYISPFFYLFLFLRVFLNFLHRFPSHSHSRLVSIRLTIIPGRTMLRKKLLQETIFYLNTDTGLTVKLFSEREYISICNT